ncbi:MAG: deaminase, partial [Pseudomonas neustonica]
VHSRIARLVYGAQEPKSGAVLSRSQVLEQPWMNHRMLVEGGVLAQECGELLSSFFRQRRKL